MTGKKKDHWGSLASLLGMAPKQEPEPEPIVEDAEEEIIATPTFDDEPWSEAPHRLP